MSNTVKIKKLFPDVEIPKYATIGSAGFDIVAHNFKMSYSADEPMNKVSIDLSSHGLTLTPGSRVLIGCGFALAIPEGYELQVRSRSGLALKKGIVVLNSPGTIDSDYRGEIGAIICNTSKFSVEIPLGERIAQCVLQKVHIAEFEEVENLDETERGAGGFGSTGHK